ncbi:MAG: hypothetical protein HYX75_22165 [Acidobacteria bacterium]|nr:hypothetical protein [Acidobacteriota bacterium]
MVWRVTLAAVTSLVLGSFLIAAPAKPVVSIEITPQGKGPGNVPFRLVLIAKAPLRSITLRAYLDKLPLAPQPALTLNRGERRSVDVMVTIPDKKQHWFYVEAEATLQNGERMTFGKSLVVSSTKDGTKQDTYETVRSEKQK